MFLLGEQERFEIVVKGIEMWRVRVRPLWYFRVCVVLQSHLFVEQLVEVKMGVKVHGSIAFRTATESRRIQLESATGGPRIERLVCVALRTKRTGQIQVAFSKRVRSARKELIRPRFRRKRADER